MRRFSTGPESKGIETKAESEVIHRFPFSTGPESKGIETARQTCSHSPCVGSALALKAKGLRQRPKVKSFIDFRSALALKAKGLRRSGGRRCRPPEQFSTGPESKGIETRELRAEVACQGMFSTGPESKGIETASRRARQRFAVVQHWP